MSQREEIGVPRGSPEIEIDRVRLAVAREGRGPALVCLHAVGHGGRDFEAFTALVRERFEVIRVDWPGQGRSAADMEPPSAARYAQLLQGLLDRLGVAAPIIIGCSIGGAAAIRYAAARPVRALVLCDPGGLLEVTPFTRRFCRAFAWFFAAGERRAWWYKSAFRAYYRMVLPMSAACPPKPRVSSMRY
jgi:pimeloyl-ACP methyl ester carboxylesterase